MPIRFSCDQCGAKWQAPDGSEGKTAKCARCACEITIPYPQAQPEPAYFPDDSDGYQCPSCAAAVQPDQVLCTNCGFNFQQGQCLSTELDPPDTEPDTYDLAQEPEPTDDQYSSSQSTTTGPSFGRTEEFRIAMSRGAGGSGKCTGLGPPLLLNFSGSGHIEVSGKGSDKTKALMAVGTAIVATIITAVIVTLLANKVGFCAGPGCIIWLLIFFKVFEVNYDDYHRLMPDGKIVYDDRKRWFSLQIEEELWLSFKPRKPKTNYPIIKQMFQNTIGDRLVPKA